ncbi:hypothetical protein [Gordonia zhaorongruii]|uniref:hypothetical protein n=1 Tax=Gordonia zhaorongruii TaxID=2597659 RepID=UPI001042AA9D|nr:hypothetical protein [Gordonia zhaorongruii]
MLYAVSGLLTAIITGPLFGNYLLYRDAVAVPRFPLTAAAFGIDGGTPRAVPQDAVLGLASRIVDGGWLVALLTAAALFGAGIGFGKLAQRLVPRAGGAGAIAGAVVGIWNPFVAERLLQGQWSLLIGYAVLGPVILTVSGLADQHDSERSRRRGLVVLAGLFAVAGFTPTGSMLALIAAAVAAVVVRPDARTTLVAALAWLVTVSPWLVGAVVSNDAGSSGGAGAFALRAEPGLGSLGTALGLGGIWNADAVPGSRASWWAAVATVTFLAVMVAGSIDLFRRRSGSERIIAAPIVLAAVTVIVALAATGPGIDVMDVLLHHVPGAGLFRDTQKYLALAVPFGATAAAAAVAWLRTWVPAGFAIVMVAVPIIAPLPDLAWGVGGGMRPVAIPDDYTQVTAAIGADPSGRNGSVAVWPTDTVRQLSWTEHRSLSPLTRMADAPVIYGGVLVVDGERLDVPTGRTADVLRVLESGADPTALARLGVGWVVIEEAAAPALLSSGADEVFTGPHVSLFRIPGASAAPSPGAGVWAAAIAALTLWFGAVVAGAVAAATGVRERLRR